MRYVTAGLGAGFMFLAVYALVAVFVPPVRVFAWHSTSSITISLNVVLGLVLAFLAAASSFFATLRRYRGQDAALDETPSAKR